MLLVRSLRLFALMHKGSDQCSETEAGKQHVELVHGDSKNSEYDAQPNEEAECASDKEYDRCFHAADAGKDDLTFPAANPTNTRAPCAAGWPSSRGCWSALLRFF